MGGLVWRLPSPEQREAVEGACRAGSLQATHGPRQKAAVPAVDADGRWLNQCVSLSATLRRHYCDSEGHFVPGVMAVELLASVPVTVQLTGAAPRVAFSLLPDAIALLPVEPAWLAPADASVVAGTVLHAASVNAIKLPTNMPGKIVFMMDPFVVAMNGSWRE
jgi:hypothetical protein